MLSLEKEGLYVRAKVANDLCRCKFWDMVVQIPRESEW